MIPTRPSATTRRRYRDNILRAYASATEEQRLKGEMWYPVAHDLAEMLGEGNVRMGAGVLAALSANKSWTENVKIATEAFRSGRPSKHVRDALAKATRILQGEDPEDVLPMSAKTGNFFLCIENPQHPTAVCVDRHAHDVAVGKIYGNADRGLSVKSRYNLIADAYREAARRLGTNPATVQAVTWVVQIEKRS